MPQKIPGAFPVSNEAVALFSSVPGEEVADYTEQVNGLYFEAGFALGLGLLVIPTCRENQIGKLHFDIRHLNTLPWKTPKDLSTNLTKRILAVVGAGPNITPANVNAEPRSSRHGAIIVLLQKGFEASNPKRPLADLRHKSVGIRAAAANGGKSGRFGNGSGNCCPGCHRRSW